MPLRSQLMKLKKSLRRALPSHFSCVLTLISSQSLLNREHVMTSTSQQGGYFTGSHFNYFYIIFYLLEKHRHRDSIHVFLSPNAHNGQISARSKPEIRNSIQASQVGGRNSNTWPVVIASQGKHWQKAEARDHGQEWNPGSDAGDVLGTRAKAHSRDSLLKKTFL